MTSNTEPPTGTEERCLVASAVGNVVIGVVGLTMSMLSSSQAILLDGLFNLVYFATALFTLKVVRLLERGDDERFPYGYALFEPLVNGLKGVLVLGMSVFALIGAILALFAGGREIAAGLAVGYGIFAAIACWILAALTARGAKRSASPLVAADAKNWIVNAAISTCVLAAFGAIFLIRGTKFGWLVPYVDPVLVISVVLISFAVPVRMAWRALMELLGRRPPVEVVEQVRSIVESCTADLPVRALYVRVTQPGRTRMVLAHVVLPPDAKIGGLTTLDAIRSRTMERLLADHLATILDMGFTADPEWGKPGSLTT